MGETGLDLKEKRDAHYSNMGKLLRMALPLDEECEISPEVIPDVTESDTAKGYDTETSTETKSYLKVKRDSHDSAVGALLRIELPPPHDESERRPIFMEADTGPYLKEKHEAHAGALGAEFGPELPLMLDGSGKPLPSFEEFKYAFGEAASSSSSSKTKTRQKRKVRLRPASPQKGLSRQTAGVDAPESETPPENELIGPKLNDVQAD